MSTPVAGALAVTPLYRSAADAIVWWDDPGQTWSQKLSASAGSGTVTSISGGTGITVAPSPITGAGTVSLVVPVSVANGGTGATTPAGALANLGGISGNQTITLTGDVMGSGTTAIAATIPVNSVADAKLRQGAALTVIGRSANSLGNVADIAGVNNQVLRVSGSVLGFGAVDVSTAQITGAMPVANGGTGAGAFTAGSVVFAGPSGIYTQDNATLFWDNTNHRLGVGRATPAVTLDVNGAIRVPAASSVLLGTATLNDSSNALNYFEATHTFYNADGSTQYVRFNSGGTANVSGAWTVISDRSMKDAASIQPYTRGLEAITALNPVEFRYAAGTPFADAQPVDRSLFGLMADEVAPIVPEIVGETSTTLGGKDEQVTVSTLEPGNLIYALINAIKELATRVEQLEAGA